MKLLVLGGPKFLGRPIADVALARGHLLGFLVYLSGSSRVCDYVVTDPARMAAYGISYPTELCDQGGPHDGVSVDGILTGYRSDTSWRREGGNDSGALISIFAATVLWWLVPVVHGGAQGRRHPRPRLEGVKAYREKDAQDRWELQKDGYFWHHDARTNTWTRGDKLPTYGTTRSETCGSAPRRAAPGAEQAPRRAEPTLDRASPHAARAAGRARGRPVAARARGSAALRVVAPAPGRAP